ncbi:hypothetical protein BT96DRAFT_823956 [Gymnopus androsaceus JB14]|uniref:UvrD-like helicase C-terminal domain-containing protein n=1 Tax=Gymnopus androsaceus JB14 TaxID=1447944 RepID=A0A6A4HEW1_9AGAR|nr:hypothetical protein BT96DRAFT_823956 [Gymnopus androsaceus JB14]
MQLPLVPTFGFTSHNSQGRSLNVVCIDLASSCSIQSAYVMLSRVRSLKGLCILRPFNLNRIKNMTVFFTKYFDFWLIRFDDN